MTYNSPDPHTGGVTYGGYSNQIVVDEHFVLRISGHAGPGRRPRRCSAPASPPTRRCATGAWAPGRRSASSGLGGLGHMGVKLAHAMGAARGAVHHLARQGRGRQAARRATRWSSRETPTRWRRTPAASTSSSTPSRRRTTSTPSSRAAQARRHASAWSARPSTRTPRPASSSLIFQRRQHRRLAHRRHRGDAGDARLLRASTASCPTSR